MPRRPQTKTSTPTTSDRKLSDVAKHLVAPSGIVKTGYPAVAAQCQKMGVAHDDWQRSLGRAILAKRANGLYAAGIGGVLISICRQVGKTFTIGTIIFALCIIFPGIKVLWTAHHSATSDETFETLSALARRRRIAPYIAHNGVRQGNGKQRIKFRNGSRIMFGAREHGFGRGIPGVTIVVFDEAQILKAKALSDMVPAANTVKNPLIIYMGTPPKPEDAAEVFKARRRKALAVKKRREAGEVVDYDTLYVEVGADQDDDLEDRATLAKANPSYPLRTPWESILRLRENLTDPSDWAREGLGIWDEDAADGGPLSKLWPMVAISPKDVPTAGTRAFGVAFSIDGMRVAVGGCLIDGDRAHVELVDVMHVPDEDSLAGIADWFVEEVDGVPRWRRASGIVLGGRAGASVLEMLLIKRRVPKRRITVVSTAQYFKACGLLLEEVKASAKAKKTGTPLTLTHTKDAGQVALDVSAKAVVQEKRSRDGAWGWAAPGGDETPAEAVSFALFGARTGRPVRERGSGVIL
jgi:hypothetical protein